MTHSGGQAHHVGDKGQRYEVRFKDMDATEHVFGWSDDTDGVELMRASIFAHPTWHSPRVIDRQHTERKD